MKKWLKSGIAAGAVLIVGSIAWAYTQYNVTALTANQLIRIYQSQGSTFGYAPANQFVFGANPTTGSGTQTFTNSPCTVSGTTELWLPVVITGQTGTWYVPACH